MPTLKELLNITDTITVDAEACAERIDKFMNALDESIKNESIN